MKSISQYSKSIATLITGIVGWTGAVTQSASGPITAGEWQALGVIFAAFVLVFLVPNAPSSVPPAPVPEKKPLAEAL